MIFEDFHPARRQAKTGEPNPEDGLLSTGLPRQFSGPEFAREEHAQTAALRRLGFPGLDIPDPGHDSRLTRQFGYENPGSRNLVTGLERTADVRRLAGTDSETRDFLYVPPIQADSNISCDRTASGKPGCPADVAHAKSFANDAAKEKTGSFSSTVEDKLNNRPEVKDAEEFQKKFGRNPNSAEAIAWLQQKIHEHAAQELQGIQRAQEESGLIVSGDPGLSYGSMLLLNVGALNRAFNPENVTWSYFHNGPAYDPRSGWRSMRGFKEI